MVMVGAAEPQHVLDDDVLSSDLDLVMAARTSIDLLRDRADQPGLVPFGGYAQKRLP